jgi:eukaryotic-like serine/threonine-protein kinase
MTADGKAAVTGAGDETPQSLSDMKMLGKYQIEKRIGAGGMGTVYLARDTQLKRVVALKVLSRDKAQNPTLVKRFQAEAQAAAQLRHANIVAVYDSGEADGFLFIAMEYVEGQDLFEMVQRRGVTPVKRSIEIIKQVAAALQHAYEQNIVHRDIKPSNLLIARNGVVKLTDLGLARSVDDTLETNITRAGTTVGTVDYMSPEQARNSKLADIRSDLYSLGCTWYQMLTGEPPYPEGSVTNKLQAHAVKPIPDPRDKNPNIPEGLTAVLQRMMAKKPEDRYQTPAELLDDLKLATLTRGAISREIFSDLSDYEQQTVGRAAAANDDDDGDEDYDDDAEESVREEAVPDDLSVSYSPTRRKVTKAPRDTNEPYEAGTRSTPNRSRDSQESSEPAEGVQTRRNKPKTKAPHETDDVYEGESRSTPNRSRDSQTGSEPTEVERGRRSKPKTMKAAEEEVETDSRRSSGKLREAKSELKPADVVPAKARSHKPLPPKREPVNEPGETVKKGLSPETLRYLGAFSGVLVVILGLGWLIQAFSGNVGFDSNPFAGSSELAHQPAAGVAPPNLASKQPDQAVANITEPVANTTTGNKTGVASKVSTPVAEFDSEALPAWASRDAEPTGLLLLTVGPGAATAAHFPTLDDALRTVTSAGAIIKLVGGGPFPLSSVELNGVKRLVLMATSSQDRTVIALKPSEDNGRAGIKLADGTLEVRGVHFTLDRSQFPMGVKILEVIDGQLLVQQSSFTATGPDSGETVAMVCGSAQDSSAEPRIAPSVLVDRVVVRGDGLKGLAVQRANADVVVRDSLLVTGSAAAFELTGHLVAGVADVVTYKPRRIVRLIRSTVYSRRSAFDLSSSPDTGNKPPRTDVVVLDSLCCAQGIAENSSLILAARWPQVRSTTEGWLTRLKWISKGSLYLGYEQLVDLGSDFKVADATAWQRVWNSKHDTRQFHKLAFPDNAPVDLSVVSPQEFDPASLAYREVKSSNGGLPGCPVDKLSVPDANSQQRAAAMAMRPRLPASLAKPAEPAAVRKIDLKKQDLGLILNSADWPSGTLFEASGNGLCSMTPAKIEGRSLRIVFRQIDGTPLRLQAKTSDGNAPEATALLSIARGSLELTNAVIEGPAGARLSAPPWLIHASEATLVLNGCRLQGSETDGPHQQGLIRWTTAAPALPVVDPPVFFCRDSFLTGFGCGLRVESGQGQIVLRNSIIAIRGDGLDLRPVPAGNALLTAIDADHVTFATGGAAFRMHAAAGSDAPISSPLRLFVERCAIVPPLVFKAGEAGEAALIRCDGPVFEQKQLEWWGASNGVAKQVVHLLHREGDSSGPSDKTGVPAWRQVWGRSNDIRMLTGDKGVYLAGELPIKWKDLRPSSFELHKSSQAAIWDEGRPIGANVRGVEEGSVARKAASEPATASKAASGTTAPVNKKGVGF